MKKLLLILILLFTGCSKKEELYIATTTSLDNSGFLAYLIPYFEEETNIEVYIVPVGTGKALALGKSKDVDILLVHAKQLEEQFVADGYGEKRESIMYNDFLIVGQEKINVDSIFKAFTYIQNNVLPFYSRGDQSGTHIKELSLWDNLETGDWYNETGQGMGSTLNITNLSNGYTLTDRATYLSMKENLNVVISYENKNEKILLNEYGIIKVTESTNDENAEKFYTWLTTKGLVQIEEFEILGETPFKLITNEIKDN